MFSVPGVSSEASYALFVSDGILRIETGYYHVGGAGLVQGKGSATPVSPGTLGIHLEIGYRGKPAQLQNLVEPADRASRISVQVTASRAGYPEVAAVSPASAVVTLPLLANVTAPSVPSAAQVGREIVASPGAWNVSGATTRFQWLRNGAAIAGATAARYTPSAADRGARLAVEVTASRAGFEPAIVASAPSGPVALGATPRASRPAVTGTARLGAKLTAKPGPWDVPGTKTSYQWLRAGKAIKGATSRTYRLVAKDVGKKISVRVTGTAAGHAVGSTVSRATKKVARGKPKVTVRAKTVRASKRPSIVVRVKAAGLAKPTGKVTVRYGKKSVTVRLKAKALKKASAKTTSLRVR